MTILAWAIAFAATLIADAIMMLAAKGSNHYKGYETINFLMIVSFIGFLVACMVAK